MSNQATIKDKFERLCPVMNENMCRLWAANEALALGYGGESVHSRQPAFRTAAFAWG